MNREWDRTDYIEEDVRRHSEEIRALTKITQENASLLSALVKENERCSRDLYEAINRTDKELDRRSEFYRDHEDRIREIEAWKSRSVAYWAIVTAVVGLGASLLFPLIRGLVTNSN
jgi:hypothetical protein